MELLFFLTIFFVFFFGAIFGSFLNVITIQLEPNVFKTKEERKREKTFWQRINRRSGCPKCGYKLGPAELVPVFSWLALLGKCKNCRAKIPARYFWVEVFSGLVFVGFFWQMLHSVEWALSSFAPVWMLGDFWIQFTLFIPIMSAIIVIFLFDWKHKIIPDIVIIPAFAYALLFISFDFQKMAFDFSNIIDDVWRSLLFALPFFAIWLVSRGRAMGFADWKLVLFLSLFLSTPLQTLLFAIGAFWVGALYSIPLLISKKSGLKSEIPFGPFIIVSFLLVFVFNLSYFTFIEWFTF